MCGIIVQRLIGEKRLDVCTLKNPCNKLINIVIFTNACKITQKCTFFTDICTIFTRHWKSTFECNKFII